MMDTVTQALGRCFKPSATKCRAQQCASMQMTKGSMILYIISIILHPRVDTALHCVTLHCKQSAEVATQGTKVLSDRIGATSCTLPFSSTVQLLVLTWDMHRHIRQCSVCLTLYVTD